MKVFSTISCLIILLTSCSIQSQLVLFNKSQSSILEDGKKEFVELIDGRIIETDSSTLKFKRKGDKIIYNINGIDYKFKNIVALQEKNSYSRKSSKKGFLIDRIIKGKINVYSLYLPAVSGSSYNSSTNRFSNTNSPASNSYYLQKGDRAPVKIYSDKLFEEMIRDNTEALSKFNEYKKMSLNKKVINVNIIFDKIIKIYNGVE